MKISRFITLNSLYQIFGNVRVLDTARKLRKANFLGLFGAFPARTIEVDETVAGVFLYVLLAQRTPKDVPTIVNIINSDAPTGEDPSGEPTAIFYLLGKALFDHDYLQKIHSIAVSRMDGTAWVLYESSRKDGADQQDWKVFDRESVQVNDSIDYDGRPFDRDLSDSKFYVTKAFLLMLHNEMKGR